MSIVLSGIQPHQNLAVIVRTWDWCQFLRFYCSR